MNKKFLTLALIATFAFAGCGNNEQKAEETAPETTVTEPAEETPAEDTTEEAPAEDATEEEPAEDANN